MYCDEKSKKYILFLFIVTIYLFHLCDSAPPFPWGSRIFAHEAQESSSTERKQNVVKGNLDDLLVQRRKRHDSSNSGHHAFWSQTGPSYADRIPDSSKFKLGEPVPRESLSWTWTKGKVIRLQSLSDSEDAYQSDFTDFSGVPGKVFVSSSDSVPHASEWLGMKPVLLCDHNSMIFTASGEGFSQLLVDKGGASPVPLFHLSLYCGYTVRTSWSDLHMVVPYDACYITQENGSYVLPMLWWGSPLKLACPVQMPTSVPAIFCSPYGMAVYLSQQENRLPVLGVLVNGGWFPFVSDECAYRVDSEPEEFIFFIPFIAPCLRDSRELHLVFDKQKMILSCSVQSSSIPQSPADNYHLHVPYDKHPSTPSLHSAQEPIAQLPDYGSPYPQNPHLSPAGRPNAPGSPAHDQVARFPAYPHFAYPGSPSPSFPHVYHPASKPAIPWFSSGNAPSSTFPVGPGFSTQDEIDQFPNYPQLAHPGFLSPTFPQVYPPGSKPGNLPYLSPGSRPGALPHPFHHPKNPLQPPTRDQSPGKSQSAYGKFLSPHIPQVYPPAGPPQLVPPQAPRPPTIRDYLQMPSHPLPTPATLIPEPLPRPSRPPLYQLPSNLYDFHNPYRHPEKGHNPLAPPTAHFPQNPSYFLSPPSEEHQQAYCPPYSNTPCGSKQYTYPYSYSPVHPPVHQYPTPSPTQNPALVKPSIRPSGVRKPKVFCSSNQMLVHLPPGPLSGIVVKDAEGNEISIPDAPKHCGYSASIGKDGKIHFSLQLHTLCHMSMKDNTYFISVTYMTKSGRMEAQFYCPAATSSSGQGCNLPRDQWLPCEKGAFTRASCLSMGCCFNEHPPACYYRMDECTADRHFVFSVPGSLTNPPLSPGLLGVANNSTCKPVKVTYEYALFKLPMDGCGARRMEVGKTLVYMVEVVNIVQTISLNYGTITRDSPVRLLVECRYVPGGALKVSYLVKTPTLGPAVQTQGVFGVQLRLAKDAEYTSYYPQYHQPLQMLLGKPLYLEVRMLNSPDPNLRLLVHYCVAYSRSGSSVWVLLYNGCPNPLDPTSQVVLSDPQSPSPHAQTRRFTMSTFQFLPDGEIKDLDEEIYFMCSTEVCSPRDGPCVEGCFGH
ncbi:uncharacterized protein [Syngnathus scovelli]|uniref:uncharacterized protein n=1 Tax=Syngnathus scovelli TaxID=161590 RepID=UPI00210FD7A9|nr:uncharacterized protein LOC125969597 [Syngnathus scovelli]